MNSWLEATTNLIKLREVQKLENTFLYALLQNLRIQNALLLSLSGDGRYLCHKDREQTFSWSTVDFDVPFSHVLQDRIPKMLSFSDLVYWLRNKDFKRFTSSYGAGISCYIYPLSCLKEDSPSLLVLFGHEHRLQEVCTDSEFASYVETFCVQWLLLHEFKQIGKSTQDLSEALMVEKSAKQQSQQIRELSKSLIGNSSVMAEVKKKIVHAAQTSLSVLIQGETGVGKEVVARGIHKISASEKGRFIAINCSNMTTPTLEVELLGCEKGAFPGADAEREGLISQADGGTLFLDEIGDMPMTLQSKLLRILETKTFRPLGGKVEHMSNFRLVSATHINLQEKVKTKEFRADLYYRLMQCPISLPPLVDRKDDIELLSQFFITQYNKQNARSVGYLTSSALAHLKTFDFLGNVRELKNIIELSCSLVDDGQPISLSCIANNALALSLSELDRSLDRLESGNLNQLLEEFECKLILKRLYKYSGNKTKAAKSLGIPLRTFTYKCQKLEILYDASNS